MARPLCLFVLSFLLATSIHAQRIPLGRTPTTNRRPIGRGAYTTVDSVITTAAQRLIARPLVTVARYANPTIQSEAGAARPGEYIVLYRPEVSSVTAAAASTVEAAITAVAEAIASGDVVTAASDTPPQSLVTTVSVSEPPAGTTGIPGQMVLRLPAELDPAVVKARLSASEHVEAVVQNLVVRLSQTQGSCAPASLGSGVVVQVAAGVTFSWVNCVGSGLPTGLALFGERCGSTMDGFRWTGLFAYNTTTGQLYKNCLLLRSKETTATRVAQMFGANCKVAPTWFSGAPTTVCPDSATSTCAEAASIAQFTATLSSPVCGSTSMTFEGVPCGPNNALIQWNKVTPGPSCPAVIRNLTVTDPKKQADWIGQCGVPPFQIQGMPTRICGRSTGATPSPPPSPSPVLPPASTSPSPAVPPSSPSPQPPPAGGSMPATPVIPGEKVTALWGMSRIGAYNSASNTVTDASAAIAATSYKVVVMDTGCETTHPDLNVVEFVDFMDAPGTPNYNIDGHGHGTHVAGTIGAKNNGAGVFGVVPGMPIIAYKVLGADGSGSLSAVWNAYRAILARLQAGEKIVAINLSLGTPVNDATVRNTECTLVRQIAAYGVAIVAAAGNDNGQYLDYNIPAACPDATVVTSMTSTDAPSSFSNLAYVDSPSAVLSRMIAAPGSGILSTYKGSGWATMSGTSMATPHVTGGYAKCFLSRACKLSSSPDTPAVSVNIPVMQAAAKAAQISCSSGFCGPQWGSSAYYGYMLSVRSW